MRELTSAPSYGAPPTRAAVRWLRDALELSGREDAVGVVELGTQRQLAALTGRSPGTVSKYIGLLGEIVVDSVPVRVDLELLRSTVPCRRAANGSRAASTSSTPGSASSASQVDLVAAIAGLVDSVTELLAVVQTMCPPPIPEGSDHRRSSASFPRRVIARQRATKRAVSTTKVARRGASVAPVRQTESLLLERPDQESSDCLPDSELTTRRAPTRLETARRNGAPFDIDAAPPEVSTPLLADGRLTELLAPLVEACRRCNRPQKIDAQGYAALRRIPADGLRFGISQIVLMLTTTDKVRSPMGLLVAKAREWNEGNTEFFEPPATVEPLPTPSSPSPGSVDVDDDADDPLAGLSADDLAVIDRQIAGAHSMPTRALQALRREHARAMREQHENNLTVSVS